MLKYILVLIFFLWFSMFAINKTAPLVKNKTCSWQCHQNTALCKKEHSHLLKPFENKIDVVYNFILKSLVETGNYRKANVIYLVFVWPFFIVGLSFLNFYLYKKCKHGAAHK